MKTKDVILIIFLFILFFVTTISPIKAETLSKKEIIGKWNGKIRINNQQLEIIINFFETSQGIKGTINIPAQNISDYQLKKINYEDDEISFELPAEETGEFRGEYSSQEIVGDYIQKNLNGRFHLIKERESDLEDKTKKEETNEETNLEKQNNNEEKKIETKPDTDPPYPVLLIFSDFGKVDKKTIKTYQMLKELYVQKGYAVFHYENDTFKFSKPTKKDDFNYNDLVNNAINYIEKISINPNYQGIHILGENQGALLSLAAVKKSKMNIESFILIDPPTTPASKIILNQLSGLQNDLLAETRYIINKLENGEKVKEVPSELRTFFAPEIQPFLISWFKYKPLELLSNNEKSILIIEKESQKMPETIIEKDNVNYFLVEKNIFIKEEKTESIYLNEEFRNQIVDFINM